MTLALRTRLSLLFVAGFALLLGAAATALYAWLSARYHEDFDRELEDTVVAARRLFQHDLPEFGAVEPTLAHVVTELVFGDRTVVAVRPDGALVGRSLPWPGEPDVTPLELDREYATPLDVSLPGGVVRVLSGRVAEGYRVVVVHDRAALALRLARLRLALGLGLPLILLVGGALGFVASRPALEPIVALAGAAERIGRAVEEGQSPPRPPPARARDEISTLTRALDRLVTRLEVALDRERGLAEAQRRFLADAAHELRTPVAVLRADAEATLAGPLDEVSARAALARVVEEAERLGALVGDLLVLARGEARLGERRAPVFLDDLVPSVISRLSRLPEAEGRSLELAEPFEAAPAEGDAALLERAIGVLVHNALVHAPAGPVEVTAGHEDGHAFVSVRDHGPGVPEEARARIFERFVRLDGAAGSGLGLAIAARIATLHGGDVRLEAPGGGGARFTLRVPARVPSGGG